MISFAFYQKMRSILAEGQFNPNEYSPQELQILVESLPMIKSDYCNQEFREGFLAYLNSPGNEDKLESAEKFELKSVGKEAPKNNKWLDFLLESNTLEEAIKKLDKFPKKNFLNFEGNEELCLVFDMEMRGMDGPGTISQPYSMVLNEVKSFFDDKEYSVWTYNQASYYSQFLCTQDYFNHRSILDFFKTVGSYARSKDSFDKLLSKAKVTNLAHIFDDNIKDGWGTQESQEELSEPIIKARFWQDLIDHKAWQAVELIIRASQEPEKLAGAIRSLTSWMEEMSGDRESGAYEDESKLSELLAKVKITPENAEHVFNALSKALKVDANYPDVDLTKADEIGFNVAKLKELAAKYQMPSVILTKLLQEEFPKFRIGQNNSSKSTDSNETKILSSSASQDSLTINSNDSLDSSVNMRISEEREDSKSQASSSSSHNSSVDNLNNFSDIETSLDAKDYTSPNVANNMAKRLRPAFKILSEERLMNEYEKVSFITFTKKVNHSEVKKLAAEYQIPSELLERTIIKAKFVKDEATTLNILEKKFAKIQSDTKTDNSLEFTIDGYNVALMPKSDPTALFAGKMTASCQHYMGHSSKQAVIPVYTDPNAGLIVVTTKQTKTVKGACFAWLSEDGLVLDSFEAPGKDCDDAFLPFVTQLARGLKDSGLKLYVGSGGHTPELLLKGLPVHPQSAPNPLTDDFKPYGDSSQVYLIDPDINIHPESGYKINSKAALEFEYKTIADFIEMTEDKALAKQITDQKNVVKCINQVLGFYGSIEVVKELFNKLNSDKDHSSNILNTLIEYANLIEKLRELGGNSYYSLQDLNSILNLKILENQPNNYPHVTFPTIEKLEEKVKLLESLTAVKLKIKEDFSAEQEIAAKIVKVLEQNWGHGFSSQKDLDEFASNCTFENLNIIRGYFELADALQNLNYDSYNPTTFDILSVILMETKGEEEPYKNESYRLTLEQLKSRLDFAKKAEKIKQELLPQYQNAFEEFAKNLPHDSIKPETIKTLQDLLKKPVSPQDLNAIPEILSKLSIDANNIHKIEKYLEITQILTKANKHYVQNKLEEISQILDDTEPKPFELYPMKQTLKNLQSSLDTLNNKDKLPEFSKELEERLKSFPEELIKLVTIEKLKASIDKATTDSEINAIPLVASLLTPENIGMIEEYFELAESLKGFNITHYADFPFYYIGKLMGKVELYPNEILNLDIVKSQLKTELEKQKLPEYKAKLESFLQTLPENSIKPETIEKLKEGMDKATWADEFNAISIVTSSLTPENIGMIEEYLKIAESLKGFNITHYADLPFYYIGKLMGKVELYPNEILNLDIVKSQLKTELEKQKLPEYKAKLESFLQTLPENSIKPDIIEKLKAGIDKATWDQEINAISIVISSLTKENIPEIEEFLEIASRLKELNQSFYDDQPYYHIEQILDNSPVNQGKHKWTLYSLKSSLSHYESEAAKKLAASTAAALANEKQNDESLQKEIDRLEATYESEKKIFQKETDVLNNYVEQECRIIDPVIIPEECNDTNLIG